MSTVHVVVQELRGTPGFTRRRRVQQRVRVVVGGGLFTLGVAIWCLTSTNGWAFLPLCAGSAFGAVYVARGIGALRLAILGEERVAKVLRAAGFESVIFNAVLGEGMYCDAVLFGPGLCCVNVVSGAGPVRYAEGVFSVLGSELHPNPVAFVGRCGTRVGLIANATCQRFLCVPDMANEPFEVDGVTVCSLSALEDLLHEARNVFAPREGLAVAQLVGEAGKGITSRAM